MSDRGFSSPRPKRILSSPGGTVIMQPKVRSGIRRQPWGKQTPKRNTV